MITIASKIILLSLLIFSQLNASDMRALLFSGNCATCHFENRSHSAPSIVEIQQRYKSVFSNKKDFITYMSEWVLKPEESKSIMSDAIDKYEIMPELGYDLDTLKEITKYIYETDFAKKHNEDIK